MDIIFKLIASALITAVLSLLLSKKDKEIGMLLTLAACCMMLLLAFSYLKPLTEFLRQLQHFGQLDANIMQILLKSVGIGLITEIAASVCTDLGNASLAKTLQLVSTILILYLSLPLLTGLMELVGEILGEV